MPEPELDPAATPGFPTSLDVREGEALFVNSIMQWPSLWTTAFCLNQWPSFTTPVIENFLN